MYTFSMPPAFHRFTLCYSQVECTQAFHMIFWTKAAGGERNAWAMRSPGEGFQAFLPYKPLGPQPSVSLSFLMSSPAQGMK